LFQQDGLLRMLMVQVEQLSRRVAIGRGAAGLLWGRGERLSHE